MNNLRDYLVNHIKAHGPIDVGQFMSIALGHPQLGYYMKKDPFGRGGDFTTAPEISQMFGEVIGAWVADVWMQMGSPAKFTLLECGPGRGTLMADILRATKGVKGFHEAARVHLLEISPVLKEKQRQTLLCPPHPPAKAGLSLSPRGEGWGEGDIIWHSTLETVPTDQPLIIVANEFLDALPVRQFQKTEDGWVERVIDTDLKFGLKKASSPLIPKEFQGAREGDIFEIAPSRIQFIRDLSGMLKRAGGAALVIDYGHVKFGIGDTFQAMHKHKFVHVLEHIGDADLTSHVDFEALSQAVDIDVWGPVEQGPFLKAIGIDRRAAYLSGKANVESALKRLTDSDQMGSLFKVIGFSHGEKIKPAGF